MQFYMVSHYIINYAHYIIHSHAYKKLCKSLAAYLTFSGSRLLLWDPGFFTDYFAQVHIRINI